MAGIAVMKISPEVLRDLMHLPADSEIIGSVGSDDCAINILVEHESIPAEALAVTGIYRSIHGVTVFDRFEVTNVRDKAA